MCIRDRHLLLEDLRSLERIPPPLVEHYRATGHTFAGVPLAELRPSPWRAGSPEHLRAVGLALGQLERSVAAERIPFRSWRFDPRPELVEDALPLTTPWSYRCLLKHVAGSADAFFLRAYLMAGAGGGQAGGALLVPLADRLAPALADWPSVPERWPAVRDEVLSCLGSRRAACS